MILETHSSDSDNYIVARFVIGEFEKDSVLYSQLKEVVRGFLVYKSIYLFGKNDTPTFIHLNKAVMYFDTALLIDAMGYDTNEGHFAAVELMDMVKECGGCIRTYSHLIHEFRNILKAFARSGIDRYSFKLKNLIEMGYTETDIIRLTEKLEDNLRSIGIESDIPIEVQELESEKYSGFRFGELTLALRATYTGVNIEGRVDNDVLSVASIVKERGTTQAFSLGSSKAMLITKNSGLAYCANRNCPSMKEYSIGYALTDIDLMAALWLKTWDAKSSLPDIVLLENAYAACQPTPVLDEILKDNLARLSKEGFFSADEVLVLRAERSFVDEVVQLTGNDPTQLTTETVYVAREKYEESIAKNEREKISELRTQLEKREKLIMDMKSERVSVMEKKADRKSERITLATRIIIYIFIAVISAIGIVSLVYTSFLNGFPVIIKIVIALIGIWGFVSSFVKKSIIQQILNRVKKHFFDKYHDKYITEIEKEFHIMDGK